MYLPRNIARRIHYSDLCYFCAKHGLGALISSRLKRLFNGEWEEKEW